MDSILNNYNLREVEQNIGIFQWQINNIIICQSWRWAEYYLHQNTCLQVTLWALGQWKGRKKYIDWKIKLSIGWWSFICWIVHALQPLKLWTFSRTTGAWYTVCMSVALPVMIISFSGHFSLLKLDKNSVVTWNLCIQNRLMSIFTVNVDSIVHCIVRRITWISIWKE